MADIQKPEQMLEGSWLIKLLRSLPRFPTRRKYASTRLYLLSCEHWKRTKLWQTQRVHDALARIGFEEGDVTPAPLSNIVTNLADAARHYVIEALNDPESDIYTLRPPNWWVSPSPSTQWREVRKIASILFGDGRFESYWHYPGTAYFFVAAKIDEDFEIAARRIVRCCGIDEIIEALKAAQFDSETRELLNYVAVLAQHDIHAEQDAIVKRAEARRQYEVTRRREKIREGEINRRKAEEQYERAKRHQRRLEQKAERDRKLGIPSDLLDRRSLNNTD